MAPQPGGGVLSRVSEIVGDLTERVARGGAIARTVEDCAIVFNAIYGPDGVDQTLYDAYPPVSRSWNVYIATKISFPFC